MLKRDIQIRKSLRLASEQKKDPGPNQPDDSARISQIREDYRRYEVRRAYIYQDAETDLLWLHLGWLLNYIDGRPDPDETVPRPQTQEEILEEWRKTEGWKK